ncbi:MAG: Colicin V production protein [Alphaproteobacteria bacterium ADurb.Bin438]|nr:MAG: Colicin V production protein [Alphaproteobacteria bacterium ADurb.Bin438]
MTLNNFDYVILGILGISLLIGLCRGFVKEILGLLSWALSAVAMIYLTPILMKEFFTDKSGAFEFALGIGVAVIVLVIMAFIIYAITSKVRTSPLNALDRIFGLVFGLLRGFILIAVAYLFLGVITPTLQKTVFNEKEGLTASYLVGGVNYAKDQFPEFFKKLDDMKDNTAKVLDEKKQEIEEETKEEVLKKLNSPEAKAKEVKKETTPEYSDKERNAMDKLISSQE